MKPLLTLIATFLLSFPSQGQEYYPYGEQWVEPIYSGKNVNRYLFGGKERIVAGGINEYAFLARTYVASQCRFTTLDPLAEKTPWLSPYAYCAGNPVNFIDPDGRHPIYSSKGVFIGTDERGIKGPFYMMDKNNFKQGMSVADVERYAIKDIEKDVLGKIKKHYHTLPERPDYDGFVTIEEGVEWAKLHPGALKNPTPDNTLYVDASLLDFGELSVSDFDPNKNVGDIDLFKKME